MSSPIPTSSSPPPSPPRRRHAKLLPLLITISAGLILRFAVPKPHSLSSKSWSLLSIFLSAILGLVLSPLPPSPWSLVCLTLLLLTRTLPFASAVAAFTNEVIWLILVSFFFARGVVKTGLGERVASCFVMWMGRSTLGLSYGLVVGEAVISPAMPSTTARAGGIFVPIVKSLAMGNGSRAEDESSKRIGAFLFMSQLQVIKEACGV